MTNAEFRRFLVAVEACEEAVVWVGHYDLETAWDKCPRGDWMLWLADNARISPQRLAGVVMPAVDRAVRNHCLKCGISEVEECAASWLSEDSADCASSAKAAVLAARAAGDSAAANAASAAWVMSRRVVASAWAVAAAVACTAGARAAELSRISNEVRSAIAWEEVAEGIRQQGEQT